MTDRNFKYRNTVNEANGEELKQVVGSARRTEELLVYAVKRITTNVFRLPMPSVRHHLLVQSTSVTSEDESYDFSQKL